MNKVLELDSKSSSAYYMRGLFFSKRAEYDKAIADYTKAIEIEPTNSAEYTARANVLARKKDFGAALADVNHALELNPASFEAYTTRARIFSQTGEYAKARNDFDEANKIVPRDPHFLNNFAWFLVTCPDEKFRNAGDAAEYIDIALEKLPNESSSWDTCAAVFAENGDFEDAVVWEERFLSSKELTATQRKNGLERLALYKSNQSFKEMPEVSKDPVTASTTPAPPGK